MKHWYWFIQNLMWPAAWTLLRFFYQIEIRGREHLKNIRLPVIIVSNHKTLFDSFLIGIALPFLSPLFPIRFMAEEERFNAPMLEFLKKIKLLKLIYIFCGGFPSRRGTGVENAIKLPLKLLQEKETVVMFPEGQLMRDDSLGIFYPGIAALALRSGANILPLTIRLENHKILLNLGEPFRLESPNIDSGVEIIRVKVQNLFYSNMNITTADDRDLETHGIIVKILRIFSVPIMNKISPNFLQKMMRATSHDARTVVNNTGSTTALEAMYSRHQRSLFSRGILQGMADLFWHHCISQPKALRNRLKLVERNLESEVFKIFKEKRDIETPITILSVGGGSARALIHSLHRLIKSGHGLKLKIISIDSDVRAIEFGKKLSTKYNLRDIFEWINDDARNIDSLIATESIDIVEMVGLLDYFSEQDGAQLIKKIFNVLKIGGLFIVANVHPNEEIPFVNHLGWPEMHYRYPSDLINVLKAGNFLKIPQIIFEPLKVHIIAKVYK